MKAALPYGPAVEKSWPLTRRPEPLDAVKSYLEVHRGFCHVACRQAVIMAAWELGENVVKYGIADERGVTGTITIALSKNKTVIRTENAAEWAGGSHEAISTITRLSTATSVAELYRQRLQQLLTGSGEVHTRLGLLRVAYEGDFRLSYRYTAPVLEIAAERICRSSI